MNKYRLLILTDHSKHTANNSLYSLAQAMRLHPHCGQIDVASRGKGLNNLFFKKLQTNSLFASEVDEDFVFQPNGGAFNKNIKSVFLKHYDAIWLRLPPPLSFEFLDFLRSKFPEQLIINAPTGIYQAGSKKFLMKFEALCPPMKICTSIHDIIDFKNRFPIVLKPFRDYGGNGIVRIDGARVWEGKQKITFDHFIEKIRNTSIQYLGVKFLKNVTQGDKRLIVVDGQIMGASLRLPAKNSWICNVAQGGQSNGAEVDIDEIHIIEQINPVLSAMGILMYGVDTLVGDDGRRILSEINATSIGGIPQIEEQSGRPIVQETAHLMWNYIHEKIKARDAITNQG